MYCLVHEAAGARVKVFASYWFTSLVKLHQDNLLPGCSGDTTADSEAGVLYDRLPVLLEMLNQLLLSGHHKEAEALAHTLNVVGALLPVHMQQHLAKQVETCSDGDFKVQSLSCQATKMC